MRKSGTFDTRFIKVAVSLLCSAAFASPACGSTSSNGDGDGDGDSSTGAATSADTTTGSSTNVASGSGGGSGTTDSASGGGGAASTDIGIVTASTDGTATGTGGAVAGTASISTTGGGVSSGGASAGGTGGSGIGAAGQVGTIGDNCAEVGTLACPGNYQQTTLVCDAGNQWALNETCEPGEYCNSIAPNLGLCVPQAEECADGPVTYCADRETLVDCRPDATSSNEIACNCWEGECLQDGDEEPCPTTGPYAQAFDCSGACDEGLECGGTTCPVVEPANAFPIAVRTPAAQDACVLSDCGRHQVSVMGTDAPAGLRVEVSVAPPWGIWTGEGLPCEGETLQRRVASIMGTWGFTIMTDDPDAPPANVLLRDVTNE